MTLTTENLSPAAGDEGTRSLPRASEHHRLRRRSDGALVGGVCAGIADYLEVEPIVVRVCFVIVVAASGFGLGFYPLLWVLMPAQPSLGGGSSTLSWRARLLRWREALGLALLVLGAVLVLRHSGLSLPADVVVPLILVCLGLALILRQAGGTDWIPGHALAGASAAGTERRRRWRHWPAVVVGAALIVGAALLFLRQQGILVPSRKALAELAVVVVALGLVVSPWFVRLARSLADERHQRIRSQERAHVAAHLHDSVLQTLALIQRRAGDPREVARLARSQERELRHWLFEPDHRLAEDTLATALQQAAAEVEGVHGVQIGVVTVGDCLLDERLEATVAAAREALTNAAKFAGGAQIDLYSEVEDGRVQVFVRDRGAGFDPSAIPADRCGVRQSIIERMSRHRGRAVINAQPGDGTEIELVMERP